MEKMQCPKCGRRAFDISLLPKEQVEISLKCPQCGKFVVIPCTKAFVIKAPQRYVVPMRGGDLHGKQKTDIVYSGK